MHKKLKLIPAFGVAAAALLVSAGTAEAAEFRCTSVIVGGAFDNVVVPRNAACTLIDTTVRGNVVARRDAYFQATRTAIGGNVDGKEALTVFVDTGSRIGGNVHGDKTDQVFVFNSTVAGNIDVVEASDVVQVCGTTVTRGNVKVSKSRRDILIGDPLAIDCAGNTVREGNMQVEDNVVDIELVVRGNSIPDGNLQVFKNSGAADKFVQDNTGGEDLQCKENTQAFVGSPNPGWSEREGQCA